MTQEPADVARLREALAALDRHTTDDPADSERIFDAVHGSLPGEERHALVERLLVDPDAARAWRLARELMPDAALDETPADPIAEEPSRPMWKSLAVAAAVLLAVGVVGWQWLQSRAPNEPVYRGVEERTITSALAPDAELSRTEPTLRWSAIPDARYRVRVLTPDLQLLEESPEIATPQYTVSPQALARVPPGDRVLWQVDARVPGEAILTSPTFSNRVP